MEYQPLSKDSRKSRPDRQSQPGCCANAASATHESTHLLGQLQEKIGNHGVSRLVQAKVKLSNPGDVYEQEADRVADQVMRMPDPATRYEAGLSQRTVPQIQRLCTDCEAEEAMRKTTSGKASRVAPAGTVSTVAGGGQPLPASVGGRPLSGGERAYFEPRFGRDLGEVRVHTGSEAADAAWALQARAFTLGRDVVFGAGQYAPHTAEGRRLLAHELTHTVQQDALGPGTTQRSTFVQRAPAGTTTAPAPGITARDIFPFPKGSRVVLGRILDKDFVRMVEESDPESADALAAVNGKEAQVTAASDDLFEAAIAAPVTLPARGDQPERTLHDITLRLRRSGDTFEFGLSARAADQTSPSDLMLETGLTASRADGGIVLSSGTGPTLTPQLRVTSAAEGAVDIAVFTEPILKRIEKIPDWARHFAPKTLDILRVRPVPQAATDADVQRIAESIVSVNRPRHHEISVTPFSGFQEVSGRYSGLLTAAWQVNVPIPHPVAGQFVQIPLEVRFQYSPQETFIGGISTGGRLHLPTTVPVNIALYGGLAAGQLQEEGPTGALESSAAAGITLGAGLGTEIGIWRVNLRYDHLINFVGSTTDVNTLGVSGGVAF